MISGKGKLIVIEGHDGTGKTTQVELLKNLLSKDGYDVIDVHLPSYSGVGEFFRRVALGGDELAFNSATEAMLILADLIEMSSSVIEPHLEKGGIVICSRWTLTTLCYQTNPAVVMPDAKRIALQNLLLGITNGPLIPLPDVRVVLKLNTKSIIGRVKARGDLDAMELQPEEFQNEVKRMYDVCSQRLQYQEVNADNTVEEISNEIYTLVTGNFNE